MSETPERGMPEAASVNAAPLQRRRPSSPLCRNCRHFTGEPLALETAFAGLSSLSSAFASVRSEDGLCRLHDRYVAGSSACASFACAAAPAAPFAFDTASTSTRQS